MKIKGAIYRVQLPYIGPTFIQETIAVRVTIIELYRYIVIYNFLECKLLDIAKLYGIGRTRTHAPLIKDQISI